MKNILFSLGLFMAFTLLTGCPKTEPTEPSFELGKSFQIAQGKTMRLQDNGLIISFENVSGDSRCPEGVQCIWAGRADCVFKVSNSKGVSENITLSSGDLGQGGSNQATFSGYTITLNSIAPPKKESVEIQQKDYVATLRVTQH